MSYKPDSRLLTLSVLVIMVALVFSAHMAAGQEGERVVIRYSFWGLPEEVLVQEQLEAAFEADHPNIDVQLDHVSIAGDFAANMLTQIAGGNPPDVFYLGEALVPSFANRGVLLDLTPFVERDGVDLSQYWEPTVDPVVDSEGHMWAFPKDNTPFMIYYNKRMFDEAGVAHPDVDWTWDEFVATAQQLTTDTDGDGDIDQWGIGADTWWAPYIATIYGNGGSVLNEDQSECLLTEPAATEAIQALANLLTGENAVSPSPEALTDMGVGTIDLFRSGQTAMFMAGRWGSFFIRELEDPWGAVPYPYISTPSNITLFVNLVIPATSAHPEEAWEFVKFVTSEQGQRINSPTGLGLPVLRDLTSDGESWMLEGEPEENVEAYVTAFERARSLPFHAQWAETIDEIAARELDAVWRGQITASEVAPSICAQIAPIIAENAAS